MPDVYERRKGEGEACWHPQESLAKVRGPELGFSAPFLVEV